MATIAVVGPGAVGAVVAAELASDTAHEVIVCARTPFDRLEIDTPTGKLIASPRVVLDPAAVASVDWVLVATKSYDHAASGRWMPSLRGARTRVAILQNGVEHVERFTPYVPAGALVPVVVDCPAERRASGRVRLRRAAALRVGDDAGGTAFGELFSRTNVHAVNSLHADRLAGRPMEVDARNGAVVRLGRKHGIATPLNAAIVALLEAVQPDD
jgi:2-dehydropantoate 2-reductase